jgi:two-component system phosphate regulon sensor histidine kinase PhoR
MESAGQFRLPDDVLNISGSAPCEIVTDAKTMKIVLDNLIDNAIKYSMDSVKIDVKLSCNLKKFIIEFSDSGIGIPPGELKKIFNKFHRIQHNKVPNVKGTGLGLYWTKEIIRNHGGKVSVLSEGENKGTKFTIELPVYQASKKRFINKLLKRK